MYIYMCFYVYIYYLTPYFLFCFTIVSFGPRSKTRSPRVETRVGAISVMNPSMYTFIFVFVYINTFICLTPHFLSAEKNKEKAGS